MAVDRFIEKLVHTMDLSSAKGIYLVNNAGVLAPIGPAEKNGALASKMQMRVNLLAPMRAAAGFLRVLEGFSRRKVIATISSGAAQRPYYGWSLYCAAKAGIEMWTRVLACEQRQRKHPAHVFSIAPGVVDTDMQAAIRATTDEDFVDRKKFVRYHEKGLLADPRDTGRLLLKSLDDPKIESGMNVDVRKVYA